MSANDLPEDEWRTYVLAKDFGMPPTVQDEQPAITLDWLLAINNAVAEVQNRRD